MKNKNYVDEVAKIIYYLFWGFVWFFIFVIGFGILKILID